MISIEETARLLNKSPQTIRIGLQRGVFPFGVAVKTSTKHTYIIYKKKLAEYIDIN